VTFAAELDHLKSGAIWTSPPVTGTEIQTAGILGSPFFSTTVGAHG